MCLDVLRALGKVPAVREALAAELRAATGANRDYDAFVGSLIEDLALTDIDEARARSLTERIAIAIQAALVLSGGPLAVAAAFCASRLAAGTWGRTFGTLASGIDPAPLLARALPQ
jgi:putative acyl-CoA dehydrogenase